MKAKNDLPVELRALVKQAVALLGRVVRQELGAPAYERIEKLRREMARLRGVTPERAHAVLDRELAALLRLSPEARYGVAHAFGLMLELMNACENAYRTYRLSGHRPERCRSRTDAVIYVLTAHPTEARSPENIAMFHAIQQTLEAALAHGFERESERLRHHLEVAWRLGVARSSKPTVNDEAQHLYSIVLRDETLDTILDASRDTVPLYLRSWVGGDKDGHPGVDEHTMTASLQASRDHLLRYLGKLLNETHATAKLVGDRELEQRCRRAASALEGLKRLRAGDGARVIKLRKAIRALADGYSARLGAPHPALVRATALLHGFPALVISLELREASDIVVKAAAGKRVNITRMLERLAALARGAEPSWYARGFIVSMASTLEHMQAAGTLVARALHGMRIPIIPLFEQRDALERSPEVVSAMLADRGFRAAVKRYWSGYFEVMLGYSDSAKESGVLSSRLAIADAVRELDRLCRAARVTPLFFHGSGGSVDRGGGSIQEQTAWWPQSALKVYKATIQGEMVERSFASPDIARGQLEKIVGCGAARSARLPARLPEVDAFAAQVRACYRERISSREFLEIVQRATGYRYLSALKMGSRPSKRAGAIGDVSSLRAIPWVLCWTQTRVLFPTWWGVGTAWRQSNATARRALARAFASDPLFRSYVKLLGFTLAKVELPIWRMYLENSGLDRALTKRVLADFQRELRDAESFVRAMSGSRDLVWFRPWLASSIRLRAPMIHPLNLIQLATLLDNRDPAMIRETVTGIASGMMTTG